MRRFVEEEWLQRIRDGDIQALELLYRSMRVTIYALARAIVRDPQLAEDVLQETFIRVFERAATYQPTDRAKAWVCSIARHVSIDLLRKLSRERRQTIEQETVQDPADHVLAQIDLRNILASLDPLDRQVVILHLLADLRHREIADLLGMNPATIRWRYQRSIRQLREGGTETGDTGLHVSEK